ncbi:glycosyl hydrolase family 16 [Kribbella orskensis]|uniref:Glycosyl hydrolase family 16 n=1 Tax=Kribbella orskensis TaxID=2512216 RepID=A0ABY2BP09_9ACTN|nr:MULTISPECIES: glycoside hydrolase family 16 protein [Kribbella]TCN39865.1 glycosyl hydrolase family 16 [Kribbella sp. VKM Ac-2500]TCO27352.1 glycosyl hydrolase family 16 [Kribbella orskensis]
MAERRLVFEDDFDGPELDPAVWLPHYLPQWSSRAATAAQYELRDSCLHLTVPPGHGLWCENDHSPAMRVSGIQSGNFSGPVGSTIGQQPYREGLVVREEQEPFWGWTPDGGYLELRARGVVSPRSMVALWMVGLEDRPERCAEICVTEMFGNAIVPGKSTAVGMGLHAFRDPAVKENFEAVPLPIEITDFHLYAVEWSAERADFFVDGRLIRSCPQPPAYPLQLMVAAFDFPDGSIGEPPTPEFVIDYIRGYR